MEVKIDCIFDYYVRLKMTDVLIFILKLVCKLCFDSCSQMRRYKNQLKVGQCTAIMQSRVCCEHRSSDNRCLLYLCLGQPLNV